MQPFVSTDQDINNETKYLTANSGTDSEEKDHYAAGIASITNDDLLSDGLLQEFNKSFEIGKGLIERNDPQTAEYLGGVINIAEGLLNELVEIGDKDMEDIVNNALYLMYYWFADLAIANDEPEKAKECYESSLQIAKDGLNDPLKATDTEVLILDLVLDKLNGPISSEGYKESKAPYARAIEFYKTYVYKSEHKDQSPHFFKKIAHCHNKIAQIKQSLAEGEYHWPSVQYHRGQEIKFMDKASAAKIAIALSNEGIFYEENNNKKIKTDKIKGEEFIDMGDGFHILYKYLAQDKDEHEEKCYQDKYEGKYYSHN